MKLHVFNPEHDLALAANLSNFTAPHAGRKLRADLGCLPALWADEDDVVLVENIEQAKKTYAAVCDILNMNEEAYANCAYIRQGEVDALINAKPKDRQKMIDDLLSLGKLEEYRERAAESVKAVNRLVRAENGKYNDLWKKADEYKKADITEEIRKKQEFLEKIDRLIKSLTNDTDPNSPEHSYGGRQRQHRHRHPGTLF